MVRKIIGNGVKRVVLGLANSIGLDAWNKQKVILDKSLFQSKFTFSIPDKDWILPAPVTGTGSVTSSNGGLLISTGTTLNSTAELRSRRHPSYQADKGLLFSLALIIPNPDATGERSWGVYYRNISTPYQTGLLFELIDGILTFSQITTYNGSITDKKKSVTIDYSRFLTPNGTLRALFDIQGQWRGVGDFFAYMNLEKVGTLENLTQDDTDNKVTIINPSLPVTLEAKNTDGATDLQIIAGCVNFATEGGGNPNYRSQGVESQTPQTIDTTERPILGVFIPETYLSQHNSRDTILRWFNISAFDQTYVKIYTTRDINAFGLAGAGDINGDTNFTFSNSVQSSIKYYDLFVVTSFFDKTKANFLIGGLAEPGAPVSRSYEKGDPGEIVITGGDYLIVTAKKDASAAGAKAYAALSLDEEI